MPGCRRGRGLGGGEVEFAGFGGPVGFHFGLEEVEDLVAVVDFFVAPGLVEVGHDLGGGFDAQVGEDEAVFEFIEEGLVELAAAEEGRRPPTKTSRVLARPPLSLSREAAAIFLRKPKAMETPRMRGGL